MSGSGNHPERRPTRLRDWDCTSPSTCFVTICVERRLPRFGQVINGVMHASPAGETIALAWVTNVDRYIEVSLDTFIVMPDHLHGIVVISRPGGAGLIRVVQSFKSITDRAYMHCGENGIFPPIEGRLWQRSFHDHIIRDDADLARIRRYIDGNPARWEANRTANAAGVQDDGRGNRS